MDCLICKGPIAALSGAKVVDGKICKTCASKISSLLLENNKYLGEGTLQYAIKYAEHNMKKFSVTSSYGELYIDEVHGLFCIAKGLNDNGKPKSGNNIFSIFDLDEVGLYCKNPRSDHNNVLVDIEFMCRLENPSLSFKTVVKKGVRCSTKRINPQQVEWFEPHDLEVFRALFNSMLKGGQAKIQDLLCGKTVYAFELEKARSVFMLPEDFDVEDLDRAMVNMLKVYQPEQPEEFEDLSREGKILYQHYYLLKAHLERKE